MNDWPVGLSTGCFSRIPILDCLGPIGAGGFNLIEVCSLPSHMNYHDAGQVSQVSARMQELGIEAYSFHAPFADHIDITSPDEGMRRRSIEEVLIAARAAAALPVRCFVIHPGPEHAGTPPSDERLHRLDHVAASLSEIAKRCEEMGILCVLENKLPHLLFGNIPDMMWILGAMTTTHVGVCLDTGHAHLAGDLDNAIQKLASYLKVIHASDNMGRFDDHLPPGKGHIDWQRLLRHLHQSAFDASIILEIAGHGSAAEVLASARESARFLRDQERLLSP